MALINAKEELSAEKKEKEVLLEELHTLQRESQNSGSSLEKSSSPSQNQRSSSPFGPLKGVTDLSTRLDEAKNSERQLLKKVVQLNETAEKLGREKERLKVGDRPNFTKIDCIFKN